MTLIASYWKTFQLFSQAAFIFLNLRKYLKRNLISDLNFPADLQKDYFYHSPFYNRTKQYMHANHFFGELLCQLRGVPLNAKERMRFSNLSACAPIFDDFFEQNANLENVLQLINSPELNDAQTEAEELSVLFFNNILQSLSHTRQTQLKQAAISLFKAQMESKKQQTQSKTSSQLHQISLEKGGFSGLMYGLLLDESTTEDFLNLSFQLGSYGQLLDDIFDIYDDAQDRIRTFANQADSIQEIRFLVEEKEDEIIQSARRISKSTDHYQSFIKVLQVFSAMIEVAFEQYKNIERNHHISPKNCLEIERANWIVDMEKASQIRKLFVHSSRKIQTQNF